MGMFHVLSFTELLKVIIKETLVEPLHLLISLSPFLK